MRFESGWRRGGAVVNRKFEVTDVVCGNEDGSDSGVLVRHGGVYEARFMDDGRDKVDVDDDQGGAVVVGGEHGRVDGEVIEGGSMELSDGKKMMTDGCYGVQCVIL